MGHIVSQDGVKVDPERIEAIAKIPLPTSKKSLQSFHGKINFVHKSIPNYTEIAKLLYKLLKKDAKFEWDEQGKKAFKEIKAAISQSLVLVSPDYSKDFKILSFASEDNIAGVLLQTNDQG